MNCKKCWTKREDLFPLTGTAPLKQNLLLRSKRKPPSVVFHWTPRKKLASACIPENLRRAGFCLRVPIDLIATDAENLCLRVYGRIYPYGLICYLYHSPYSAPHVDLHYCAVADRSCPYCS